MSLNRSEQRIYDYLQSQADERQYWKTKVQKTSGDSGDNADAAARVLELELWRYYVERSEVVAALRQAAQGEGAQRMSMRNLAELLLRLWVEPRPKPKPSDQRPQNLQNSAEL